MILDGRDGAVGMTCKKVITGYMPSSLFSACKTSVFITDETFDKKVTDVCYNAIEIFEKYTATTVLQKTVTVNYEYFKGKNKLPFEPHITVSPIDNYVISGFDKIKYLAGGLGSELSVTFTAGYPDNILPYDVQAVIVKVFEWLWHNETGHIASNPYLFSLIKSYSVEIY
jgi:hypothetical protein